MFMNKRTLSFLLLLLSNTIFGFSFLFSKTALEYASPMVLIAERFILAFVLLNILLLTGKMEMNLRGKNIGKLLLMGFFQPILYFVFETYGLKYVSSSYAGIMIGLVPIACLILGKLILNQEIRKNQLIFVAISIAGVFCTSVSNDMSGSFVGTILLLGAVLSGTTFTVLSSKMSDEFSSFERTYVMFALGCVVFVVAGLVSAKFNMALFMEPLRHGKYLMSLGYLGIISSVLAFLSINYALTYVEVYVNGIMANFTPLVSVLAGVIIMHDIFTPIQVVGIILILISVVGVSFVQK